MVSDDLRGGDRGAEPPAGGGPRACAGGGRSPPARARSARAAAGPLFSKKRKEVGHFVTQNGGCDVLVT